jgi:hypothetical protein
VKESRGLLLVSVTGRMEKIDNFRSSLRTCLLASIYTDHKGVDRQAFDMLICFVLHKASERMRRGVEAFGEGNGEVTSSLADALSSSPKARLAARQVGIYARQIEDVSDSKPQELSCSGPRTGTSVEA